jgi:hypothetical protein
MASPRDGAKRLRKVACELARLADRLASGEAERDEFDGIVAEVVGIQQEHFGSRPRARPGGGARSKILSYLKQHVGQPVHGEELGFASGIHDWPRRIRELRVEDGYEIAELGNSIYQLESLVPNHARAAQWKLANEIRNRPGSGRSRIEVFLAANVGEVVTRKQLDYVAKIAEGSRRVRELRDEAGWPINSFIDEPELGPGDYRLLSTDPDDRREASQRLYPEALRQRVFERDGYTCQVCKRNAEAARAAGDTRFYLEVHHTVAMADELATLNPAERNRIENLITLCHSDHLKETAKLHRQKLEGRRR